MENNNAIVELPKDLKYSEIAKEIAIMPVVIDNSIKRILSIDRNMSNLKLKIDIEEDKIKKNIYFDDKLTNKDKRELALKEKIISSVPIMEMRDELNKLVHEKENEEVQQKFLQNKYSSLKYLVRLIEVKDSN